MKKLQVLRRRGSVVVPAPTLIALASPVPCLQDASHPKFMNGTARLRISATELGRPPGW